MTTEGATGKRRAGLPSWLARRPPMNPKLIIVEGEATQDEIQVRLPMTIGRVQGNGLVISHPLVSRTHCEIVRRDDWLWVRDMGSANGTFIGEQRVEGEAVLKPGDRLTVGPLTFVAVYQQQGLIPPRIAAKMDAQKVIKQGGDSGIGSNGPPAAATASPAATQPAMAPAAMAPNGKEAPAKAPPAPAAAKPAALPPAAPALPKLAPLPAAARAKPAESGRPAGGTPEDPFAAWAAQNEPPKLEDKVVTERAAPGTPEAVAELASTLEALAEGLFDDLDDDEELSDDDGPPSDDSDVLAAEIAQAEDDPGSTQIVKGNPFEQQPSGPVVIDHQPLDDEDEGEAVAALPEEDEGQPQQGDVVLFHLLHQADRLQRRMLENYQQAVITAEMVSRLQQAQLDQLRHEMDRLHELTRFLQQAIISKHPDMKRVPENEESLAAIPECPASIDGANPELTIEHVQHTLRQRMTAEEQAETRHWEAVRKFFKSNGLG